MSTDRKTVQSPTNGANKAIISFCNRKSSSSLSIFDWTGNLFFETPSRFGNNSLIQHILTFSLDSSRLILIIHFIPI